MSQALLGAPLSPPAWQVSQPPSPAEETMQLAPEMNECMNVMLLHTHAWPG